MLARQELEMAGILEEGRDVEDRLLPVDGGDPLGVDVTPGPRVRKSAGPFRPGERGSQALEVGLRPIGRGQVPDEVVEISVVRGS